MFAGHTGSDSDWYRAVRDQQAFVDEQQMLAHVWTFLGLARDLRQDGDWFTASLATRSVFVQRFGDDIRAYENICAHRGYPLRHGERGNGALICGYHHWHYNRDGLAVGIPVCSQVFGKLPHELNAGLTPVDIAQCGGLIFGRFAPAGAEPSLAAYLANAFPVLEVMSRIDGEPDRLSETVAANWRLCFHITLDDYHGVAIHPTTFGRDGYVRRQNISYLRLGLHSAFLNSPEPDILDRLVSRARAGRADGTCYSIFQCFPNFLIVHLRSDKEFWFRIISQYVPLAHDRTQVRSWIYPMVIEPPHNLLLRGSYAVAAPFRRRIFRHYVRRVMREDHVACERMQALAQQLHGQPLLGRLEERIEWFEQAYRAVLEGERIEGRALSGAKARSRENWK